MANWEEDLDLELTGLITVMETLVDHNIMITTGHIAGTGRLLAVSTRLRVDITKLQHWTAHTTAAAEAPLLAGAPALLHHSHQPDEELAHHVAEADCLVGLSLTVQDVGQAHLVIYCCRLALHVTAGLPAPVTLRHGDQLDGVLGPCRRLAETLGQVWQLAELVVQVELLGPLVVH